MGEETKQHAFEDELFFSLRQQRNNWARIALGCVAGVLLSLVCLIVILPLNETRPYVIMVDKTTGEAEKIVQVRPVSLDEPDAIVQAELVSYVVDRETYQTADNRVRIPDVMERSSGQAAETLAMVWNSASSSYPPNVYGSDVTVRVVVKSISLTPTARRGGLDLARVRVSKIREEKGKQTAERSYVATVGYEFLPQENAKLESVWKNPLGFTVKSYRIDAETAE